MWVFKTIYIRMIFFSSLQKNLYLFQLFNSNKFTLILRYPLRVVRSENYRKINREKKPRIEVQNRYKKLSKVVKSDK
jgi:hypothetical protein